MLNYLICDKLEITKYVVLYLLNIKLNDCARLLFEIASNWSVLTVRTINCTKIHYMRGNSFSKNTSVQNKTAIYRKEH